MTRLEEAVSTRDGDGALGRRLGGKAHHEIMKRKGGRDGERREESGPKAYNSYKCMVGAGKLLRPTGTSLAQGAPSRVELPPSPSPTLV